MGRNRLVAAAARYAARLAPWARYAPRAVAAALAVLVVFEAFWVARVLVSIAADDRAPQPSIAPATTSEPAAARSFDGLAAAHLFGVAPPASAAPPAVMEAPATSLELTLTGTLVGDRDHLDEAIIADGRSERVYRPGDLLENGGARLHEVRADRVVLERDGRLETLAQRDWPELGAAQLVAVAVPLAAAEAPPPAASVPAPGSAPRPHARTPDDPVGEIVRFTAYNEGSVVGLRARPGRDKETFLGLGLQPNDVITGVDGTPLRGPNSSALLTALTTKPTVRVSVVRNGIPQVVLIPAAAFAERFAQP